MNLGPDEWSMYLLEAFGASRQLLYIQWSRTVPIRRSRSTLVPCRDDADWISFSARLCACLQQAQPFSALKLPPASLYAKFHRVPIKTQ